MDCHDVRAQILQYQRGRLASPDADAVRTHLAACPACAREEAAESVLTDVLEHRLPQYPASPALKRRLATAWPSPVIVPLSGWRRRARSLVPALAVAAVVLVALPFAYQRALVRPGSDPARMVTEAVNDHLRILDSQHPLDIESGGIHQVKPWFEGRLDFAPVVSFAGDPDFPLLGGAVGYYLDRKAAVFVYKRRLHTISLFVFRAEGLPWPERGLEPLGGARVYRTAARGFNVILWRAGELGYALVADVDPRDLGELATKLLAGG